MERTKEGLINFLWTVVQDGKDEQARVDAAQELLYRLSSEDRDSQFTEMIEKLQQVFRELKIGGENATEPVSADQRND